MAKYSVRGFNVQDADLKLLRVFASIINHGGFSAAQYELNMSLSAISAAMSQLEDRLGFKLCERGRGGFQLTEGGRLVEQELAPLVRSIEKFQGATDAFKGNMYGQIKIAADDSILSNPQSPLPAILRDVGDAAPDLEIQVEIMGAAEMEQALLDNRLNLALGPFREISPSLERNNLYDEAQILCCGKGHPAFGETAAHKLDAIIATSSYAARSYSEHAPEISDAQFPSVQVTSQMEAILALVLSGRYLGYMAAHFCQGWIDRGALWSLLPQKYGYNQSISLIYRKGVDDPRVKLFLDGALRHTEGSLTPSSA